MPEWSDWVPQATVDALREAYMPDLPPLERGGYLVAYLFEVGPTMAAGMGAAPITHGELCAWMSINAIVLQPWEARFLRRLSYEYLKESQKAEKRYAKAPWRSGDSKPEVSDTQAALRALANL